MRLELQILVCGVEDCPFVAPWTPAPSVVYCPVHRVPLHSTLYAVKSFVPSDG